MNIREEYNMFVANEMALTDIYYPVLEADDTVTSVDDDSNKMNFGQKLLQKVNKLIKELLAIIERTFDRIWQFLKRVAQTDVGFKDTIRKAIRDRKPLEAVKLIAYQYNEGFLNTQMTKVTKEVFDLITNLKTSYADIENGAQSPMDLPTKELYQYIFSKIGCKKDIFSMDQYYLFLKHGYRVEKKEMLFKGSETRNYYNIALSRDELENVINAKKQVMKSQTAVIKTQLSTITMNRTTQNDVKKRAMKQYSNASHLYNFYSSFLNIYTQLQIEKMMSYRAVLKKLYHIA